MQGTCSVNLLVMTTQLSLGLLYIRCILPCKHAKRHSCNDSIYRDHLFNLLDFFSNKYCSYQFADGEMGKKVNAIYS